MNRIKFIRIMLVTVIVFVTGCTQTQKQVHKTSVSIQDNMFLINGEPTYKGIYWNGNRIEGLLMNSRMVQGIFDDENPETRLLWKYPDTEEWSPDRNTDEFIAAMPAWKEHGLLAFTLNLQGGSPTGYGNKGWKNTAFDENGELKPAYFARLEKILNKADELGMVCILGYFYFGQDEFLNDEAAIINATNLTTDWLLDKGYRNVLVEVNNECNIKAYDHDILKEDRIHELIDLVKSKSKNGFSLLTSTSYGGNYIPLSNVVKSADFILIHGNGVEDPARIKEMVRQTKEVEGYREMPVVFNEDDHYGYDASDYNMKAAVESYASWGYFDFRRKDETDISIGYQSVPVDWRINSERKLQFFEKLKEITTSN